MSDQPVGPKGPFSGLASGAGASAGSWLVWGAMEGHPAYYAGAMAGLGGTVGYLGGLAVGEVVDEFYRKMTSREYGGRPAIAYSNRDLLLVSAASVPASYVIGKAAASQLGLGVAGTIAAAGGLSLFTTMAYMFLNDGSFDVFGILDTIGSWFNGGGGGKVPESSPETETKKAPECTGICGKNPIDNWGSTGRFGESTLLDFQSTGPKYQGIW